MEEQNFNQNEVTNKKVNVLGWEKLVSFLVTPIGGIILYCCNHDKRLNPQSYWIWTLMGIIFMPILICLATCAGCVGCVGTAALTGAAIDAAADSAVDSMTAVVDTLSAL